MRVAAIQAAPEPGEIAANAGLAARLIAMADGARVAVLPELFLCAYDPPTLYALPVAQTHVAADEADRIDDPRLDPIRSACREAGTVVVVGAAVAHADGRRTCSAVVVAADGRATAAYDKENLWGPHERALFTPGERGTTLTVDGWRLALGICYDGCFPEHGRAASTDGADAYLCPSGYLAGSQHRRDIYYAARALDNTMYVVFANSVGAAFNGGAAVYDPEGRALVRAGDQGEAVVCADLSRDELDRVRRTHTMLIDRPRASGGPRREL